MDISFSQLFLGNIIPILLDFILFLYLFCSNKSKYNSFCLSRNLQIIYMTNIYMYYYYMVNNFGDRYFAYNLSLSIVKSSGVPRKILKLFGNDPKIIYNFFRAVYWDLNSWCAFLFQIELIILIQNPIQISNKRGNIYALFTFLLFFSYFPLDIFGHYNILFLIRICVTLGFPLITFYTLFIIIALSRYTQRTLTKVIGISIQSIYIILFYFHIYLNKKLIHGSYPSYLSIDGICLDCISIVLLFIFHFFSNDSLPFKQKTFSLISRDTLLPLINSIEQEPLFNFNISKYVFKQNYLCLLEGIITIAKDSQNKKGLNALLNKENIILLAKYNCIFTNENKVSIESQIGKSRHCFLFNHIVLNEHYPEIFHNIRYINDISYDIISESFDIQKNMTNLTKFCQSEGKSGSIFFFTHNRRFILKTIPEREFQSLSDFALIYNDYLIENKLSYLVKIYGLYTIDNGLSSFHVILMENISPFPTSKISYKFDLKGSLFERDTKDLLQNRKIKALKDNDFLELKDKVNEHLINISSENNQIILETIQQDIKLLTKANLMDYSLYICIISNSEDIKIDNDKYCVSNDNKYIYCIGIIDYLTSYKMRKVLEKRIKNIIHFTKNKNMFSALEPILYQQRLYNFIKTNVFI